MAKLLLEAANDLAAIFERVRVFNAEFECEGGNSHGEAPSEILFRYKDSPRPGSGISEIR
jgi:hypothetical protein